MSLYLSSSPLTPNFPPDFFYRFCSLAAVKHLFAAELLNFMADKRLQCHIDQLGSGFRLIYIERGAVFMLF